MFMLDISLQYIFSKTCFSMLKSNKTIFLNLVVWSESRKSHNLLDIKFVILAPTVWITRRYNPYHLFSGNTDTHCSCHLLLHFCSRCDMYALPDELSQQREEKIALIKGSFCNKFSAVRTGCWVCCDTDAGWIEIALVILITFLIINLFLPAQIGSQQLGLWLSVKVSHVYWCEKIYGQFRLLSWFSYIFNYGFI